MSPCSQKLANANSTSKTITAAIGTPRLTIANRRRGSASRSSPGWKTSLFCATQPGLESGGYYHDVLGRVEFAPNDPAADVTKARALGELLEKLDRPLALCTRIRAEAFRAVEPASGAVSDARILLREHGHRISLREIPAQAGPVTGFL